VDGAGSVSVPEVPDRDGIGVGPRALQLAAATPTAAITSSSATRWNEDRQKQSEHRSRQCELGALSPVGPGAQQRELGQHQP
jgi:hypothetical protein